MTRTKVSSIRFGIITLVLLLLVACTRMGGGDSKSSGRIAYGNESRQWLLIYRPMSAAPANGYPVYIWAHQNGGAADQPSNRMIREMTGAGYAVLSWESLPTVEHTLEQFRIGQDDADLMWSWFKTNASSYNLNPNNVIIGGDSRGSGLSWELAHSGDPAIKGIYMYNALTDPFWLYLDDWNPDTVVNPNSPPIQLVYGPTSGDGNEHRPENGESIRDEYITNGIGDRFIGLTEGIGNGYSYPGLLKFAQTNFVPTPVLTEEPAPQVEVPTPVPTEEPKPLPTPMGEGDSNLPGRIAYGSESRQWLIIYRPSSTPPANGYPVYIWAHANGGAADRISKQMVSEMTGAGYAVLSWESLPTVEHSLEQFRIAQDDADLMWSWFKANASGYDLNPNNVIMGGNSRGSGLSWEIAHSGDPAIKGIYMYNAMPDGFWLYLDDWNPTTVVNPNSPPIQFAYGPTRGDGDNHRPEYGDSIRDAYIANGIGDRFIGQTEGIGDGYQYPDLLKFSQTYFD